MDPMATGATEGAKRRRFRITGTVQGVGFRPLVYRVAHDLGLCGFVSNGAGGVTIEVEGAPERILGFQDALYARLIPPARIDRLLGEDLPPHGYTEFSIVASNPAGGALPAFPPDLAVCPECLAETNDPAQRFAGYAFTSCTYCGPRYSIIRALPYDRPLTAMAPFSLCDACRAEYTDPLDRRFHAQTIACPHCGPRIPGSWQKDAHRALLAGQILAVKGIGGFHLVCDAAREGAVQCLRARKRRPRRPFAVMARSLQAVADGFDLTAAEQAALTGREAPIVLLKPKHGLAERLPLEALAPGFTRVGVMLPYTPLHHLMFPDELGFLVVTSGNASGYPIARTNEEALAQLGRIADHFVLHDREIAVRVEDSVCQAVGGEIMVVRRSRGYVPEPLAVPMPDGDRAYPTVLATGAEQKNTVCLLHRGLAVLSQHHGDLSGAEHLAAWHDGVTHLTTLLGADPEIVAYDPHPQYEVSRAATRRFADKQLWPVYHHHAHMAACMAEHGLTGQVIAAILDGTGYGTDGTLWGFEILTGGYTDFRRQVHLQPIRLPGGEAAIRQPWLLALSLVHEAMPAQAGEWARAVFPEHQTGVPIALAQLDGRLPAPQASSAGRLFDAVAAMLGLCTVATYEGEAAMVLGEQAEGAPPEQGYPVRMTEDTIQTAPIVRSILGDLSRSVSTAEIARRFHQTVADMVCRGARLARERTGLNRIVLGGGVWANRTLLARTEELLARQGFSVFVPRRVPAGDGGIALGQAVSALWRWHRDVSGSPGDGA